MIRPNPGRKFKNIYLGLLIFFLGLKSLPDDFFIQMAFSPFNFTYRYHMIMIQLTGLSGSGKSTISNHVAMQLTTLNYPVEILDGDVYRNSLNQDLGFSKADRKENNRRLGILGMLLLKHQIIVIISTINPYEEDRRALSLQASNIYTVWINSSLETLISRDTKGLYKRALKGRSHPDFLDNLSGINDSYEPPAHPDLIINTDQETELESSEKLLAFMLQKINPV